LEFYQWLVPIVAVYFTVRIVRQYKKRKRLLGSTIIWILFWITVSILAIVPDLVSFNIARLLGFKSNINAVIFVALGFLFVFMFYLTAIVEKLEKQLTELVRQLAIENQKLKEELGKADNLNDENTPGS
jgi:hypothetical protein